MNQNFSTPTKTNSQKRKQRRFRLFVALFVLDVALIIGTLLLLPAALRSPDAASGQNDALLAIQSITLEGNTRYDEDTMIAVSGLKTGQSVFSINKRQTINRIQKAFPYAEKVSVQVNLKRQVTIHITEAEELGAVYVGHEGEGGRREGHWVVVSREGTGLAHLPLKSERPFRRLYLKGATTLTDEIGKRVLDDRSLSLALQLKDSLQANGMDGVGVIDMTDLSNIRLNWKNQILIALGSDSNLSYEIAAAMSALPKILSRHGEVATGLLNLSQYSDSSIASPVIIFTPSSLLNTTTDSTPNASSTGQTAGDS